MALPHTCMLHTAADGRLRRPVRQCSIKIGCCQRHEWQGLHVVLEFDTIVTQMHACFTVTALTVRAAGRLERRSARAGTACCEL